jgi:hypothetical protein
MRMVHPLTSAVYEEQEDGTVLVTEVDGQQGWFTPHGRHIRGDVLAADPHILDWVGGRKPKTQRVGRLRLSPEDESQATGAD